MRYEIQPLPTPSIILLTVQIQSYHIFKLVLFEVNIIKYVDLHHKTS